jgi:succinate dehydrogenase hydrophobic anchor subunit
VTVHAMLGVRSILFDLGLSTRMERMVTYACTVVGAAIIVYGFWLTYTILSHGTMLAAMLFR